jgi:hypothetical protein
MHRGGQTAVGFRCVRRLAPDPHPAYFGLIPGGPRRSRGGGDLWQPIVGLKALCKKYVPARTIITYTMCWLMEAWRLRGPGAKRRASDFMH